MWGVNYFWISTFKWKSYNCLTKFGGIEWFPEKRSSRKMFARSRNSEAFVMGLEISFSGDFVSQRLEVSVSNFETRAWQSRKVSNLAIYTPVLCLSK